MWNCLFSKVTVTSCTSADSMGEFPLFYPCQHLISSGCFALAINISSSVQFNHSVVSDSLQPHESQHARPPCSSPTPRVHSNSCASSWWCHSAISSSVVPFSSCQHQGIFQWVSSFHQVAKYWPSVLPMHIQDWFPLGLTGWLSLQSKGLSRIFSNTTVQKHQIFGTQLSLWSTSHTHTWLVGYSLGPEAWCSELLCNKVLLKYKGDRESFWHRHQKGAERVPPC